MCVSSLPLLSSVSSWIQIRDTADPIHINLALCCLKLKRYRESIKHAKNALHKEASDISSAKASYLIGKGCSCPLTQLTSPSHSPRLFGRL
jgi:hypothetical protein